MNVHNNAVLPGCHAILPPHPRVESRILTIKDGKKITVFFNLLLLHVFVSNIMLICSVLVKSKGCYFHTMFNSSRIAKSSRIHFISLSNVLLNHFQRNHYNHHQHHHQRHHNHHLVTK